MIDASSTLAALRDGDETFYVPADHPLARTDSRVMFAEALAAISKPDSHKQQGLPPHEDPALIAFMADTDPMGIVGAGHLAAALQRANALLSTLPDSLLKVQLSTLCNTDWRDFLAGQLSQKVQQTTALEYHITRLDDTDLTIDAYCDRLRAPDARARILSYYPVLDQRLGLFFAQQVRVFERFAKRMVADWAAIPTALGCDLSTALPTRMHFGEGDLHNGGQAVIIVTLSDDQKLVYKPRDISVEVAFDTLLGQLNDCVEPGFFHRIRSLSRDGYGWVAFVAARPCASLAEVPKFYERTGGLLAILHVLGGFDFHQENLIAHGAYPVVIDLETLFFSFKNGSFLGRNDPFLKAVDYPAVQALLGSVMSTLLLPQHARNENVSGIAGGAPTPQMAMRYNPERNTVDYQPDGTLEFFNRPTLDGAPVAPAPYADDVACGFRRIYCYLMDNQTAYLASDGPLGRIANHRVRMVVRDTQVYASLLEKSWHPTLLGKVDDLVVHLLHLWRAAEATPSTIPLFLYELEQLLAGDVPYFTQAPKELHATTAEGQRTGYQLDQSGFAAMQDRLRRLSVPDLELQIWIMRGTLEVELREGKGSYQPSSDTILASDASRRALCMVHGAVMHHAQRGNGLLDWLTVTPTPDEKLMLGPVDVSFYNGISGLTLYLAYYAEMTGTADARADAEQAFANLERQIADDWGGFNTPGAMSGLGGAAYCMIHLAALWDRPDLLDRAFMFLEHDLAIITADNGLFDLTVGAAGLVCVSVAGFAASGQERFRSIARRCGAALALMARHDDAGAYWVAQGGDKPLTGLSHGFSGVILAFSQLERIDPDPVRRDMVAKACARENADFVPERQNWIDWRYANLAQRDRDDPSNFQYFWCNGGAGIGLARLAMWRAGARDPQIIADLRAAAHSTLSGGLGHNHSLCHGDMGNLDFLYQATMVLGDDGLHMQVDAAYARAVNSILEGHIYGGASRQVSPPDLMTGLSGVAYGLMRRIDPHRVPDILSLAAPNPMRQQ